MTDLITRARELAARERKLYDQRTIPAVLEELADEVERLTTENEALLQIHLDQGMAVLTAMCKSEAFQAKADELRAEAANSAAQRDEAEKRATQAEERLRAVEARLATLQVQFDNVVSNYWKLNELALAAEAELARIRAADRKSITVRTTEAAKMRKGQAI